MNVWHHWPALHIWCLDFMAAVLAAHMHFIFVWPSAHMAIMCFGIIMWWPFIGAIALADAADIETATAIIRSFPEHGIPSKVI